MAKKIVSYDDTKPGTGLPDVVEEKIARYDEIVHARALVADSSRNAQTRRPIISIIDDDGDRDLLSVLRPIAQSRGIPIGTAIMTSRSPVVTDPSLRAQLIDLQNNHGWEILSHTHDHINLGEVTPQVYEDDHRQMQAVAHKYGFHVENMVYPWGQEASINRPVTTKYFRGGFSTAPGFNQLESVNPYDIRRVGLGSMMGGSYNTLEAFKTLIDETKAANGWLVFMTHIGDADAAGVQLIEDVLDYAIAQGIDFVAPRDGMREFGPLVESGRSGSGLGHFSLKPHGVVQSSRYLTPEKLSVNGKSENDPPTAGSGIRAAHFGVTSWSLGNGYVTEWGLSPGWGIQHFYGVNGALYSREWGGDAAGWKPWYEVTRGYSARKSVEARSIPPHSTVNISISDTEFLANMTYSANPVTALPSGVMWQISAQGNGVAVLRLANLTAEEITVPEGDWRIRGVRM